MNPLQRENIFDQNQSLISMLRESASRKGISDKKSQEILDFGPRSLMGNVRQESLKSLSDANHHSSNHSYSRGRSTAKLGGGQVVSVPPS